MDLSLETRHEDGRTIIEVGGEIDVYTAPRLRDKITELVSGGNYNLVIDMEKVDFLDSTGLGVLVGGLKKVRAHDGSMRLICNQERLLKIFRITGLGEGFRHPRVAGRRTRRALRFFMPTGAAPTATGVTVSIAHDPALVRTVRLVAAAVARRTGRDEEFVEEVRLAVGEACALLIGDVAGPGTDQSLEPVTVAIRIDGRLAVDVISTAAIDVADPPYSDIDGVAPWALLRGLIENFNVAQDGKTTTVSMSWPAA